MNSSRQETLLFDGSVVRSSNVKAQLEDSPNLTNKPPLGKATQECECNGPVGGRSAGQGSGAHVTHMW